ncbi:MAG: Nucleoside triphosphate pyrophosphohydrolase [Chlamydiae bacterium]|nr:Nucleoside triphosphate pyrophosphohydrolase [Chlamydiota bacterium]
MKSFEQLIEVAEILNSPGGCPWDLIQTFQSLRPYILEEAHEALEAVDRNEDEEIIEELGDLLYTVIFYAMVAKREKRFSLENILEALKAKLIRRHPHVFADTKVDSVEDVIRTWDNVKKEEKKDRKSPFDGIPKALPSLQRAHKILGRIKKHKVARKSLPANTRSKELASKIFEVVETAVEEEVDIESAFREMLTDLELELQSTQS